MKKAYSTPLIRTHGSVEAQTAGNATGDNLDQSFPINTPKPLLTFS